MVSRRGQAIDGVLLLDKPAGLSSNRALQRVRRLLNARKAGHTGTLDPFATGLMVTCFGAATKYSAGMFEADKQYVATLQFGAETDTGDNTGQVVTEVPLDAGGALDEPALREILQQFVGRIKQIPPMYSALKRDGTPLYEYARKGIDVERQAREVEVYRLELLAFDRQQGRATLKVDCSKGTYIRTLAQDIGRAASSAAHLVALRRTQTAGFSVDQAYTLEALEAHADPACCLLPVDILLQHLPQELLAPELARRFSLGQTVQASRPGENVKVRVYAQPDKRFLGTARRQGQWLRPDRLMPTTEE